MKTPILLATLIALPIAFVTAAEDAPPAKAKADPARMFKAFDRNADGGISLEEYKMGMAGQMDPSRIEGVFKKKDADSDGKLSLPELMFVPPREVAAPVAPADGGKKKKE